MRIYVTTIASYSRANYNDILRFHGHELVAAFDIAIIMQHAEQVGLVT